MGYAGVPSSTPTLRQKLSFLVIGASPGAQGEESESRLMEYTHQINLEAFRGLQPLGNLSRATLQ